MSHKYLLTALITIFSFLPVKVKPQALLNSGTNFQRYLQHYVRERETPSAIAHEFNVSTKDFLAINNFPENVKLKPGQLVLIRALKDGENPPMEAAYVPEAAPEKPVNESPAESERPAPAEKPAAEKPAPEKPAPAAKREPATTTASTSNNKSVDVGPNGAKYEKTTTGYHTVEKGQTFYHISVMYHLTVDQLKKLNNLTTTDIKVGQKLKVSE